MPFLVRRSPKWESLQSSVTVEVQSGPVTDLPLQEEWGVRFLQKTLQVFQKWIPSPFLFEIGESDPGRTPPTPHPTSTRTEGEEGTTPSSRGDTRSVERFG